MATRKKEKATIALTPGSTSLGDYRERLIARIAELTARDDIKVIYNVIGDPVSPEAVDAAADMIGWRLSPAERELYARMNGCCLVWISTDAPQYDKAIHKPKKGRPAPALIEELNTDAFRIINFWPIEDVCSNPVDYAKFMSETGPPRIGFDFPGNYRTPALVIHDGRPRVELGDDHGAAWESHSSTLEDYVETVLATWGDVELRRAIYLRGELGMGRAYFDAHPVPLASLLPPPMPKSAAEEAKRVRLFSRTYGKDLTDAQIADAARAMHSPNEELLSAASMRLHEQPLRAAVHMTTLVDALEKLPPGRRPDLARLIDVISECLRSGPALSAAQRETVFRWGGYDWAARGRVGGGGGVALLPAIEAALNNDKSTDDDVMAAAHAAVMLGPDAVPLLPLLESRLKPPDFEAREKWGWDSKVNPSLAVAVALIAIEPQRSEQLFDHLRIFVRSDYPERGFSGSFGHMNAGPNDLRPVLARLPEAVAAKLAPEIEAQMESTNNATHALLDLLGGLGRAGIEAGFRLLDGDPPEPTDWSNPASAARAGRRATIYEGVLGRTFAGELLTVEERAHAAAVAKAAFVQQLSPNRYFHPAYVGFTWRFGGIAACAPELSRQDVIDGFLEGIDRINDVPLVRFVLEQLRAEGVDAVKLKSAALKIQLGTSCRAFGDWLRAYAT